MKEKPMVVNVPLFLHYCSHRLCAFWVYRMIIQGSSRCIYSMNGENGEIRPWLDGSYYLSCLQTCMYSRRDPSRRGRHRHLSLCFSIPTIVIVSTHREMMWGTGTRVLRSTYWPLTYDKLVTRWTSFDFRNPSGGVYRLSPCTSWLDPSRSGMRSKEGRMMISYATNQHQQTRWSVITVCGPKHMWCSLTPCIWIAWEVRISWPSASERSDNYNKWDVIDWNNRHAWEIPCNCPNTVWFEAAEFLV